MELSEQARKRAIEAFKGDFLLDLEYFRAALQPDAVWDGIIIKGKLHRLKGGASFLGLQQIQQDLVRLESQAMVKPIVADGWLQELDKLEKLIAEIS